MTRASGFAVPIFLSPFLKLLVGPFGGHLEESRWKSNERRRFSLGEDFPKLVLSEGPAGSLQAFDRSVAIGEGRGAILRQPLP